MRDSHSTRLMSLVYSRQGFVVMFMEEHQNDKFTTYLLLQVSAIVNCLPSILNNLRDGQSETFKSSLPSVIFCHLTIWQYIFIQLKLGVK